MKNPFQSPMPGRNSFLPEDYIAAKTEARANVLMLTLFAIAMAGVVGAFFVTNRHWQRLRSRQEMVSTEYAAEGRKIEQLKALESQRASMMEKAEITAALVEKLPRWAVLGEMTLRMPTTMRLDLFTIKSTREQPPPPPPPQGKGAPQSLVKNISDKVKDPKKEPERRPVHAPRFTYAVTIDGTAHENNDVADFLASLKRSPAFDRVELQFIRDGKESGRDVRKFQVTASLRQNAGTGELSNSLQDLVNERTRLLTSMREAGATAAAGEGRNP
ncbi:MAG: PilN domain-containing protein [Phycisphaerae bacterium]|nr:PilN domain-containing protein [Phycisphaerae bacterium]